MTQTIQCAECGQPAQAHRAHAKYCPLCRLMKNLQFLGTRKYTCMLCDAKFAPLAAGDSFCAGCDLTRKWHYITGACALCLGEGKTLLHEDVRVCLGCAKDPAQRKTLIRAIAKKRNAQAVSA